MELKERLYSVFEILPHDHVKKIEYEGPFLCIYTDDISLLTGESGVIPKLAKALKKKVIIRPTPEIRLDKEKAKEMIKKIVPENAKVDINEVYFDDRKGEVHIYTQEPALIKGRGDSTVWELINTIKWRVVIHRKPAIDSSIIKTVDLLDRSNAEIRNEFLDLVGMRINREKIKDVEMIRITSLGAANEVGRSSFLISTDEGDILLDAGLKPGSRSVRDEFPMLQLIDDIDRIECIILTHAHFDHCAALPYLFKYGYRGPVYMTEPTKYLMTLIISDYLNIRQKSGLTLPYSFSDLTTLLAHTITLEYGEVADIAPDVKLTLYNAGHILGSAIAHLHFGEGYFNLVYTGDFKFDIKEKNRLLDPAFFNFKRNDTVIMEGTYGGNEDIMPSRTEAINSLIEMIKGTLERNGKVLMPMLAVGRAQEILLILYDAFENGQLPRIPVFVEGMIHETSAIHTKFVDELSIEVRRKLQEGNPFTSRYFELIKDTSVREEILEAGPCIIIATSGMLTGGPVMEYFRLLAEDERNSIIFTSYQAQGTLGRRVKDGEKEVLVPTERGEVTVKVNMRVYSAEGFSGHSDRIQLLEYIRKLPNRPRNIFLVHGEPSKLSALQQAIRSELRIPTYIPDIGETIRLR
jgi:KH/beta-lactamase-domain protein